MIKSRITPAFVFFKIFPRVARRACESGKGLQTTIKKSCNTDPPQGRINLALTHKGTNQSATVSLEVHGDEVTGTVTFKKAKFQYQRWNFSGSYSLQITGKILPKEKAEAPNPIQSTSTSNTSHHSVEVALLVIGIGVLSVLTDGAALGLLASI